ncbi:hypothetical protein KUTeg_009513 [Tegillarca granosa]|uniref:Rab-GAP TBC domain-containing protein n=1 Tax=Tegillarca granosa TaxID=220873 RepID=A0ABQ9F428_TEGGR|nr:hypothetical protein KUTeg_009513 [Tegillarca granosa]
MQCTFDNVQVRRNTSSSSEESSKSFHLSAKDYVESLHQNSKTTLLYGKNNVLVQPKEDVTALAGYLSLHQSALGLTIMWTPNQLMNGCCKEEDTDETDRSLYWDYALTVYLDEIVYIHCHQQPDCGGTIVLVGQDGVQRPPIHFPKGGHLLAFLSCLETGLLPRGQLDPPLWSQRGKVFPKLKRKGSRLSNISKEGSTSSSSCDEDEATDYVFRIITTFRPDSIPPEMLDPKANIKGDHFSWASKIPRLPSPLTTQSETSVQSYAKAQEQQNNSCLFKTSANHRATLKQLCDTMKKQIISRAFYGYTPFDASAGLTEEKWKELYKDKIITDSAEIYRLVYYGGVAHEIRKEVWPYLLGHYRFKSTPEEREKVDINMRTMYEKTMSEWLAVEAIVKQREKEVMLANIAKLSSESTDGQIPLVRKDSTLSNDVFESQSFDEWDDISHPETVPEESSATGTTCTPTQDRKQSLDLVNQQSVENVEQTPQNEIVIEAKREYLRTSFSDSPDDGLGDSIAHQSSQERSKLDSADSDLGTDIYKPDSSFERTTLSKLSCSIDSAEADDEDARESDNEGDGDDEHEEEEEEEDERMEEDLNEKQEAKDKNISGLEENALNGDLPDLISPMSPASNGGAELLDNVTLNLHRIDKDVQRCDRNYWYFSSSSNLDKLRNVMCTYVWEHLDIGYVQGMCDLVAPLLVIFDDELVYDDVFAVWETIWAAKYMSSPYFVLFIALALVEFYRDIILDNNMDFTDIIKFFNEMAERHKAKQVLKIARDLVLKLQTLIDNK